MSMNSFTRKAAAAALISAMVLASGCGKASQPAATTAPPDRPTVTSAPGKIAPPDVTNFTGYSLKLKPVQGRTAIMQEPIAAQLIMEAFSSERLRVQDDKGQFNNKLEVLDPEGKSKYSFTLSSDGRMLLKSANDGRVFRMPEYVYYLMEENLWSYNGSLMDTLVKWQPDKGTATLELQLPRLLKTAMLPAFGYSMAYFVTYKIYGVNTSVRNTAWVYLLITYAGYDIQGTTFAPDFLYTTPVSLTFTRTGGDYWKLTELKQPPQTELKKDLFTNVRKIFPYDCMDAVMTDLENTDFQVRDIVSLATEYLQEMGFSGLTVES